MAMAVDEELHLGVPSCLHLVSAFLAMEPPRVLISLARDCGGGSITERVQRFIWDHCISKSDGKSYAPYLKSFLKKLVVEVESQGFEVLDELYEQLSYYMTSLKEDESRKGNSRVFKCISFLFSNDCYDIPSCPKSRKLVATLQCSLNMLEGDTGCSVWPSSLFLSEFILSFPQIFSHKSCFEVGSGAGLVGICLAHVKALEVMLSDGDISSLENMKLNLGLNKLSAIVDVSERTIEDQKLVKCFHLPWESAMGSELQDFTPDIILGADVIYDPLCLPHLVRVLALFLSNWIQSKKGGPAMAFIASVIRNIDTFNRFLALADEANLSVKDVTDKFVVFNFLPYMQSYPRSSVRLFSLVYLRK